MGRAIPGNGVVVLVVEDEALTRLNAVAIVEEAGFEAIAASDADEAVRVLESREDIQAVFTDVQMPGSMIGRCDVRFAGRYDESYRRPTVPHNMGQSEPVHRARHLHIGEDCLNVIATLQHPDGFIGIRSGNGFKPGLFDDCHGVQPCQSLVLDHEDDYPVAGNRSAHLAPALPTLRRLPERSRYVM